MGTGRITGIVKELLIPKSGINVFIYERETGALVNSTTSAGDGTFVFNDLDETKKYTVTALSNDASINNAIDDGIQPVITDPYFSNVILLLHGDGANGGTIITDSSSLNLNYQQLGNTTTSNTQVKFGTASIRLPASSTTPLSYTNNSRWNLGGENFTIEMWAWEEISGSLGSLICRRQAGTALGWVYTTSGMRAKINGTWSDTQMTWTAPSKGTQHFYAFVLDGTTLRTYIDGIQVATKTGVTSIDNPTFQYLTIGVGDAVSENRFKGYIDDLRFTKGVCRYPNGTSFTPPTAAFPNNS